MAMGSPCRRSTTAAGADAAMNAAGDADDLDVYGGLFASGALAMPEGDAPTPAVARQPPLAVGGTAAAAVTAYATPAAAETVTQALGAAGKLAEAFRAHDLEEVGPLRPFIVQSCMREQAMAGSSSWGPACRQHGPSIHAS
eukprot:363169-Chlamydomonas_euryale.AAC.22